MVDRSFGLGIIGTGMGATPHAAALNDLRGRVDVRGVFSRTAEKRAAFAEKHGFPVADSLEALLDDPGVDGLLIITPPNARRGLVDAAVRAGKHILMEKPVERTLAAASDIVATCERAGVTLGIVFQQRFREGALALRELVYSGRLGRIAAVQLVVPWWRPQQGYYDRPGRGTMAQDGGGVLISQAIHSLDLMLSFTGPVAEVQAVAGTTALHQMETEDFVGAGLRLANGALGALMATTANFPGEAEYLVLNCEHATARLMGSELTLRWADGRSETIGSDTSTGGGADPMAFPHHWHRALIEDFVDACRTGRPPVSSGRGALAVHRLIEALLASSAERRAVSVPSA